MAYYPDWPPREDEADFPKYGMSYGGYQPQGAPSLSSQPAAPSPATQAVQEGSKLIPGLGLGLQVLGTGLGAYGAYKQGQEADKQYELQKDAIEYDQALSLEDRARMEEEKRRRAELEAGGYASNYLDRATQSYGRYNAMTGR